MGAKKTKQVRRKNKMIIFKTDYKVVEVDASKTKLSYMLPETRRGMWLCA